VLLHGELHHLPGELQQGHLLQLPLASSPSLPLLLLLLLLSITGGLEGMLFLLQLLSLHSQPVALLHVGPVEAPGLHHDGTEEPCIQTPIPFPQSGYDGIILCAIVKEINSTHEPVVVIDEQGLGDGRGMLMMWFCLRVPVIPKPLPPMLSRRSMEVNRLSMGDLAYG